MTSAFDFYMPSINFSEICNVPVKIPSQKLSSKKLRQANRRREYIIKKWHETYTYKLLMYGIQNVDQYDLMCANTLAQLHIVENQISLGIFTPSYTKLLMFNVNKFNSMKQEIANMKNYINQLKNTLYNIVSTSTYLFREHKKEVLAFVNSELNIFTY
jgi:hypothetical protein